MTVTTIDNLKKKTLLGTQMFSLQLYLFIETHVKGTSKLTSQMERP